MRDIDLPKYHIFPNSSDLKETCNYIRTWEISVPEEDSLEWSLVLSHLMSANLSSKDECFKDKLQNVTGDLKDIDDIKSCISGFNPFLNRYSCFYKQSLQKVVSYFKERLEKAVKLDSNNQNAKLKESSKILKSTILLVSANEKGDLEIIESFLWNDQNTSSRITLYYYPKTDQKVCKYNFGMKKEKGKELRNATLKKILKETHILKSKRDEIASLDENSESFVISILKSEHKSTIPELYKTPYLAGKLVDAKYEMDPREKDSKGFSAFYHALMAEDEELVYILYYYAANACHKTNKTFRDPDESIVSTLDNLRKTFEEDKKMSNDFQENCDKVKDRANQLYRFNEFLIQLCERIFQERNRYDDGASNNLSETIKRKNIILALLETYESFFFFDKEVSGNCFFKFNDYFRYNAYYKNLDYSATLFFFDNIFSLKERLVLHDNEYSELESSFLLSVLSSKYFSRELSKAIFPPHNSSLYSKSWKDYCLSLLKVKKLEIIPLTERLQLLEKIRTFKDVLQNVEVNDIIILRIPEEEVLKTLDSLPEVKDELELQRLIHYLETATKRTATQTKQVLAIQRALQVLGECMINGRKNPRSLCYLLSLCLPEETFKSLKQTRNVLSHMENYTFAPKFKAEEDTCLFPGIQKDLEKYIEEFKNIFDVQTLRLAKFLFRRGLQKIETSCSSGMTNNQLEDLIQLKEEYKKLSDIKSKPYPNNSTFKNIDLLTNTCKITFSNFKKLFPEEIISEDKIDISDKIEDKIEDISDNIEDKIEDISDKIEDILCPLRYLLMLIVDDGKDLVDNIKSSLDDLLTCGSNERRDKTKELRKRYEILISELDKKTKNTHNLQNEIISESCIEKFKKRVKGFTFFSDAEKKEIRSKIPQNIYDTLCLIRKMQKVFESQGQLTIEQENLLLFNDSKLFLSKRNFDTLKKTCHTDAKVALQIINKADNPVKDLNDLLDGTRGIMRKNDLEKLCNRLNFSEDLKEKLDLSKKLIAPENNLFNILNRIKLLRAILIEENTNIRELWRKARGVETQQFAKYKIVQRYIRDSEVRASVEALLFDCMTLLGQLGGKSGGKHLWVKASSLFSGINLRNVLGHGNPTFETVGKLLDPDDLPSVLVEEMLKLIKDEEVIQVIYNFCLETGSDFDEFHKVMNDDNDEEYVEVRSQIKTFERWKRYSMLIPRVTQRTH